MDQTLYNIMIVIDRDVATDEHVDTDVIEKEDEEPDECLAPPDPIPTTSRKSMSDYSGKDGHIWSRKPKSQIGRAALAKKRIFVPGSRAEAVSVEDPLMLDSSFFEQKILIFKNYQVFTLDISEEVVSEGGSTNTVKYEY